jgi:carbamoyltransferase
MLFLGISDIAHDTAAALLADARPVAAIEENKLSRASKTAGIPHMAIESCLRQQCAQTSDLTLVGLGSHPKKAWLREEDGRLNGFVSYAESRYPNARDGILWKLDQVRVMRSSLGPVRLLHFEHHLAHAASAFYPSDFDRALVLTLDQCGDMWSGLLALGEGTVLKILRRMRFPNSLGWFYSRVTELLGFRPGRDEHKVQWLSKEGTPDFLAVFRKLFSKDSAGLPRLELRHFVSDQTGRFTFSPELYRELQIPRSTLLRENPLGACIARSAQEFLEETVIELAETYREKTRVEYLCLAGGVFLNVLLVRALESRAGFSRIFVQPVSGNAGSALGAAYLAQESLKGPIVRVPLSHLYLGPEFEDNELKAVLDNCKIIYRYLGSDKQLVEETVNLLRRDKIVAWCQGKVEFGHRALGNRSILASPFSPYVAENLNRYLKRREQFHPFALSVPTERASEFFDCSPNCRFMASVGTLKEPAPELERFAFNNRTVRVHIVEKHVNPRFWSLLGRFGEVASGPVLVNTSFNLFGEPMVCDPREAIRSFYCSGIDSLVMGNFLVTKQ